MMQGSVLILLSACFTCAIVGTRANRNVGHFKGGSITWKADDDNPNNVNIFYRLNFRHDYANGYLHEACTNQAIEDRTVLDTEGSFRVDDEWISWAKYICTDYDENMDWSAGYHIMPYTFQPGQTRADVNFEECCWPASVHNNGNDQGSGRGWNMISTIDITPRPDTGRPNSPPVSGSLPVYRLYKGCKYTRYIRAWDADGDMIRCRWTNASRGECNVNDGDICGELYVDDHRTKPGAILEEDTCKITFNRRNPAGTYAVAVMVEDYAPADPSTPLSKIPVQFLIEVLEREGRCRKPVLLGEDGVCMTVAAGQQMITPIAARSSTPGFSITSFETIKPSGVHVSPVTKVEGSTNEYSVTLTWTPTRDQIGRHVICYEAEEARKFSSDMACIYVNVVDEANFGPPLEALPYDSAPAPGSRLTGNIISIEYSRPVRKVTRSTYITITDSGNIPIYKVDSSSRAVSISGTTLTFDLPYDLPLQRGGVYTIRLDDGSVKSTLDCDAAPRGTEWSFVFSTFCEVESAPFVISPAESVPAPGTEMVGNVVSISYNKKIRQSTVTSYITIYDSGNNPVFRIDTSSNAASVAGRTLSFEIPSTLSLAFRGRYRIRMDEGAVMNAMECELGVPPMVEWDFVFVTLCGSDGGDVYEPLTVIPGESRPSPDGYFAGQTVTIAYNKQIQQTSERAYITIFDAFGLPILEVDTASADVSLSGNMLSFVLSTDLPLQFRGGYRIRVDEGSVRSAQDCDLVAPPMAEWDFGFVTFCDDDDFQEIAVVPTESTPYPQERFSGRVMRIGFNKQIRKPQRSAYISLFELSGARLYTVDILSPEVSVVDGDSVSFVIPTNLPLRHDRVYKIRVDEWAVISARDCDVSRPDTLEWQFTFVSFCEEGDGYEPLTVLPEQSHPEPNGNITARNIVIQYNKPIVKPTSSAYVTVLSSDETDAYAVDTSSDDVTIIEGTSLVVSLPADAALRFGAHYVIRVDQGAAMSAQTCDVSVAAAAEWSFEWIGRLLPGQVKEVVSVPSTGNVDCRENFMQTFVSKRVVGEIDPSTMYLNDRSCTGREYNETHYVVGTAYESCKTTMGERRGNLLTFENVIYVPPQPYTPGSEITRDHFIEIHLTCHVAADKVGYLSFDPNVTTIVYHEEGYGNFNFSLRMYTDETFVSAYNRKDYPVGVQLSEQMNFEGRVTCDGKCDLMLDSCWATPSTNPFDTTRFPFITEGCPIDDTVRLLPSPSSKKERFTIDSFAFLGDNIHGVVYVHCDMRICDPSDPNSRCTLGCNNEDDNSADDTLSPRLPTSASQINNNNNKVPVPDRERSDAPWQSAASRRVGKRDVGSSSAAYSSTSGQLRVMKEATDVQFNPSPITVTADVVEIAMLATILIFLVILVAMQCSRRTGGMSAKEAMQEDV